MRNTNLVNNRTAVIVLFILGIFAVNSFAQEMSVPPNLQAALFKKIFSFNKTLTSKGNVEVAVLGNGGDAVAAALKEVGVNAKAVGGDQIPAGVSVVYVMPGTSAPKQQSASKGVLSISGVTSYVEDGKVAIAVGVEGGKPKIIINMGQLKAEGQELSSDLLKIAKVI